MANEIAVEAFLKHINYYRFSGYALAFEQNRHQFFPGTSFEQIREAYEFDRALRDLFTESIELIELDLRTNIAYSLGQKYGPFGHVMAGNFFHRFSHQGWLDKLHEETERSSELFILHYKNKYQEYPNLPIWVAMEIMFFGALSKMYGGLLKQDQKLISARYSLQPDILRSWFHHLVYVRNLCAHHSRLWDKIWAIKPDLPAGNAWLPPYLSSNARLFASLLIQNVMLCRCAAEQLFIIGWRERVENLIQRSMPKCPDPLGKMGMTPHWHDHPLWKRK
jgi:abortive infection bacteriophage resistance protein